MKKIGNSYKTIVYESILNGIIKGEYKANQIINEQELVEKLKVSKSPIREALALLCNEGVLRNLPRYGYEVVQLTKENIIEVLNFRFILEGGFLKETYDKITEEQLKHLYYLNDLCKEPDDNPWIHWERNSEFHLALLSYSNNEYARTQLQKSMIVLKRAYIQFFRESWRENLMKREYHDNILNSIKIKDIDNALKYLKEELIDF
ncbi:GntR family transcriptional regulator [Fusobacterium varium]|uniref:GntR family transcriptional regulator n=1 Tax=Fusobacterium TaxID=848 RepID=UPI0030D5B864